MIPVGRDVGEISAPVITRSLGFPPGTDVGKGSPVLDIGTRLEEIQVNGEALDVQGMGDPLTGRRIGI